MTYCTSALLVTCVSTIGLAQPPADPEFPEAVFTNRLPTIDEQTRALREPFELIDPGWNRPAPKAGAVSIRTLRHKVPKAAQKAYEQGLKALEKGDLVRALDQLGRAAALDGEFAAAHSNLGVALARERRFAEAETAFRRALALEPYMPITLSNLGLVLAQLGRMDEAEPYAKRALELDPTNKPARKLRSLLSAKQRQK